MIVVLKMINLVENTHDRGWIFSLIIDLYVLWAAKRICRKSPYANTSFL